MVEWIKRYEIRNVTCTAYSTRYFNPKDYEIFDRKNCITICTFTTSDAQLNKKLAEYVLEYLNNRMIRGGII